MNIKNILIKIDLAVRICISLILTLLGFTLNLMSNIIVNIVIWVLDGSAASQYGIVKPCIRLKKKKEVKNEH